MKPTKDTFVKVPLWWIQQVTKVLRSPQQVFVAIWLLHLHWESKSMKFTLPNGRLSERGVDRKVKRRALVILEKAGLISVERRLGKSPKVTLILL